MSTPDDELRARLHRAADAIEPGEMSLDRVRATARRRSLRTRAGAVAGIVGLVAAGTVAVVATVDSDDPDTIVSADPTIPESPESTEAVDDTIATTLPDLARGVNVEVVQRSGVVGQAAGVGGAPQYGEWAVPWRDGFIVGAQAFTPQPLPAELPEEVVALFPPEVVELFDGELPPTINEATAILSEAGLLDEVTEILAANPAASEAIYSVPVDDDGPTLDVRFTTDGVTWEPLEMTMPPGATYLPAVHAVGDRLVVAYATIDPTNGTNADGVVRVASTADLVTWDVQEVVTPPPPVTFPAGSGWSSDVAGFAANEAGWVLSLYSGANFNVEELLPADVRAELMSSETGYGMSTDETGVTIDRTVGDTTETESYTWDELGVAPEVAAYLGGQAGEPTLWSSRWGATPTPTTSGADTGYGQLVATSAGFLRIGEDVEFSADGNTWTVVDLPVEDAFVSGSITFDGGAVLLVSDFGGGTELFRVDETGRSAVLLDVSGLPRQLQSGYSASSRNAIMIDASEPPPPPPPLVVEHDGHRLTIDHSDQSIEIVDLTSGEVVGEANLRSIGADGEGNVVFDEVGVTVTDPTTGEVLVTIPNDLLDAASQEQRPPDMDLEYNPDFWLLATRDGERFLLDDVDEGVGPESPMVGVLASNGSTLLAQIGEGWVVYDLP
jgi:hypothetical protein